MDRDYSKRKSQKDIQFQTKFNEQKGEVELAETQYLQSDRNSNFQKENKISKTKIDHDEIRRYKNRSRSRRENLKQENKVHEKSFSFIPWIFAIVVILVVAKVTA